MASEMMEALMALCQERGIDQLYLIDRLEQSLARSYADLMNMEYGAKVTIDPPRATSTSTGSIRWANRIPRPASTPSSKRWT